MSTRQRCPLPPKDPSTMTQVRSHPKTKTNKSVVQPPQKQTFRHKVQQANANTICNASSDRVGRRTMRELLPMDVFCVPIFQRRYCWTETQWNTLLEDAVAAKRQPHSLGRLTCTQTTDHHDYVGVPGRSCILDGQQRFTTTTLLLAAIRDVLVQQPQADDDDALVESIHKLLFSDFRAMRDWMDNNNNNDPAARNIQEGQVLPFVRLIPTFCDRRAYYASILPTQHQPPRTTYPLDAAEDDDSMLLLMRARPWQAKQFFLQKLQASLSLSSVRQLLRGVLDGLTMLYFPVAPSSSNDGTDNLMVIYERLALRDATFCRPRRADEYQSMDGADMVRNLLLGSCDGSDDPDSNSSSSFGSRQYYHEIWLPLEQIAMSAPAPSPQNDHRHHHPLTAVLQAFLLEADDTTPATAPGVIGGRLYADFQAYLARRLVAAPETPETVVRQVGMDLLAFARQYNNSGKTRD